MVLQAAGVCVCDGVEVLRVADWLLVIVFVCDSVCSGESVEMWTCEVLMDCGLLHAGLCM